jgi:hypothetical protein
MSGANTIKVVARFRPQNKVELASGGQPIVSFEGDDTCSLHVRVTRSNGLLLPTSYCPLLL